MDGVGSADGRGAAVGGVRRDVQQALLEHVERAAVAVLLPRLEHEQHPAAQLLAVCRQQPSGACQHRGVAVVATGMHHPVHFRCAGLAGVLHQRQGVHVTSEQHGGPRPAAGQQRGDTGRRVVQRDVEWQTLQRGQHGVARARRVQPELRPPVQVPPQGDDRRRQVLRVAEEILHGRGQPSVEGRRAARPSSSTCIMNSNDRSRGFWSACSWTIPS